MQDVLRLLHNSKNKTIMNMKKNYITPLVSTVKTNMSNLLIGTIITLKEFGDGTGGADESVEDVEVNCKPMYSGNFDDPYDIIW